MAPRDDDGFECLYCGSQFETEEIEVKTAPGMGWDLWKCPACGEWNEEARP